MSKRDDELALAIAGAAVLGVGAAFLAYAYQSNEKRKSTFFDALAEELDARDMHLVEATFGRGAGNRAIWSVTYENAWSETRLMRVPVASNIDPYTVDAASLVASALV